MQMKTKGTVKKTSRHTIYAMLFSLLLVLPAVEAAAPIQPIIQAPVKASVKAPLNVTIIKPLPNATYFMDKPFPVSIFNNSSFAYGRLTIIANVTGDNLTQVLISVDGTVIGNFTGGNVTSGLYNATWSKIIQAPFKHTIKVVAFNETANASASVNIVTWRLHVLPFAVAAALMLPAVIPKTTIHGLVFNLHKNPFGYTFYAIYVHYKSVNLMKKETGTIVMKRVHVGPALNMRMLNVSPLRLARISSTFLGMFV